MHELVPNHFFDVGIVNDNDGIGERQGDPSVRPSDYSLEVAAACYIVNHDPAAKRDAKEIRQAIEFSATGFQESVHVPFRLQSRRIVDGNAIPTCSAELPDVHYQTPTPTVFSRNAEEDNAKKDDDESRYLAF
jgi:hypothetical protein